MSRKQEGSLSPEELAGSAFRAWTAALAAQEGQTVPVWERWDEADQEAWLAMCSRVAEEVEQAEGTPYHILAANAFLLYNQQRGEEAPDFFTLAPVVQLAWQALVRHLVNLLGGYDPQEDGDLSGHEAHWSDWTQQKLADRGKTEAQLAAEREQRQGLVGE